jgi:uncharacterized lipoprotein YbaY
MRISRTPRTLRFLPTLSALLLMVGCSTTADHDHGPAAGHDHGKGATAEKHEHGTALTGTVTYRQRTALLPEAIVKVWLQDMSRPGLPVPEILDEQEIRRPGQVPVAFSLRYDPATIDPTHTYTLLARIYEGDRTRFINAKPFPVITKGGCMDRCEVVVDMMQ